MFDKGSGPPLVVIPGVHGRWEWTSRALMEMSGTCRAISYSLAGDIGSDRRYDAAKGFDNYVEQLDAVLDAARLESAALCGVSFGGFIAVRYAALRPNRVRALVLASAPGPGWTPNPQQARWIAAPWVSTPVFLATAPARLWPELRCAKGGTAPALKFAAQQTLRVIGAPGIPSMMSSRIRDARKVDFSEACEHVTAPTLVLSGEAQLDRVVPVETTRKYASMIKGARYLELTGTGHLGVLTQPERFAGVVSEFVHANNY